jgi:hypothetical protein
VFDWIKDVDWQATATLVLSIWGAIRGGTFVKQKVAPRPQPKVRLP